MRAEVIPPRTEMHACQNDLLRAAVESGLNIEKDIGNRAASPCAARDGGDAERTAIVATVLHFDEGARAAMQAGEGNANQRFNVKCRRSKVERFQNETILAVICHNAQNIWQITRLFWI